MLLSKLLGASLGSKKIQFVGAKAGGNNAPASPWTVSLTDLTGGIASSPSAGDIVIVYFGVTIASDATMGFTTSGYAELYETFVSASVATNMLVGYKMMGSTPDSNVTVNASATTRGWSIAIAVFRGVNQTTPFDAAFTTASSTASMPNPPAITPVTVGSVVVSGAIGSASGSSGVFASSDLSGFFTASGTLSNSNTVGVGYSDWTGGSFDPSVFTGTTTQSAWSALTLALKPA